MTAHEDSRKPADQAFVERVGRQLRGSVEQLDAATRSRLNRARQAALEQLPMRRPRWQGPALVGTAAALLAAIAVWNSQPAPESTPPLAGVEAPDLELLMADESFEMLEDLDFYAWLATAETEATTG